MQDTQRHLVFLSLFSILEILAVLVFPKAFVVIFIAVFFTAVIFFITYFKKKMYLPAVFFAFILLFSCINPYRIYLSREKAVEDLIDGYDGKEVECSAVINDCRNYGSYSAIIARIYSIEGKVLDKPFDARLESFTGAALSDGDKIVFSACAEKLSDIEEDRFDTSTYLRSKRVFAYFPSAVILSSSSAQKQPFLSRLKDYTREIIYKYVPKDFNFDSSSVSYAMFAGDKDYISRELKEHFTRSGITHILCVSGMHLTIIMGVVYALLSFFTLHKKTRCILVIIICILYTAFTGFSLSTIRACIMCSITFAALMLGQKSDTYTVLFFTLLTICTFSPYAILDISLILSFSATLGIIVFSEFIFENRGGGIIKGILTKFWAILSANLGAVFFTLPFACYFFGSISVFSVITTLLTSYLSELLLTALLILILLSPIKSIPFLEPILQALGIFCDRTSRLIIYIAKHFSSYKYAYTDMGKIQSILFICVFLAILIILTLFIAKRERRSVFFCALAIAGLGIIFSFLSVYKAINDDGIYRVSYFRQNQDDRQLSIKLEHHGYLIVNADSNLCLDKSKAEFNVFDNNNYILLIPDEKLNTAILADSIIEFGKRYGIKRVYVPDTNEGTNLAISLRKMGILCHYMPPSGQFGNTKLEFASSEYHRFIINDGKTSTCIVFADKYKKNYFDKTHDICAFFTRTTKNQFKSSEHDAPECSVFYTRMGRGESYDGIENTFGKESFTIKE